MNGMKAKVKDEEEEFVVDDPELQAERGEGMDAFEFLRQLRAEP